MADITYNEMIVKWMGVGEQLSPDEVLFMVQQNVEPNFNDHSSRCVLEAYRSGWARGFQNACDQAGGD